MRLGFASGTSASDEQQEMFNNGLRQMPIDGTSSTAIVIDDEDEDEDELFTRDEKSFVSVDDAAIVYDRNSRTQSSYVQDSELRPSDL